MSKPSIFSSDYRKIKRRKKKAMWLSIIFTAFIVILIINSRSFVSNFNDIIAKIPAKFDLSNVQNYKIKDEKNQQKVIDEKNNSAKADQASKQNEISKTANGVYQFKFPNDDVISITFQKNGNDIKITGIKQNDLGIFYDIRDDAKAIVFDNPKISDIWILNADGSYKKLSIDYYVQKGEGGEIFKKPDIMKMYSNYIWAARPKFLKDGRIVYQTYLPWFKSECSYYFWVVDSDGQNQRMVVDTQKNKPADYSGFTDDGRLIVNFDGTKYALDVNGRNLQAIK